MLKNFSDERFDVVVLAGQSNAKGHGLGAVDRPYAPDPDIWYLNNEFRSDHFTIGPAAECVVENEAQSNLGLAFAREYLDGGKLAKGRKLLIVRAAVGGTGFLQGRWKTTGDLYLSMMDMIGTALSLNPKNSLIALLWHQGETDAIDHADYEIHYKHLTTLLRSVREAFNVPNLPFIAGDFVPQWRDANLEICAPVIRAIRDVCRDCGNGRFVETDGLLSNSQESAGLPWRSAGRDDTIHFSRPSVYELGRRYFRAFVEIEKKGSDEEPLFPPIGVEL